MANHTSGGEVPDKGPQKTNGEILNDAPIVQNQNGDPRDAYRKVYISEDRTRAFSSANQQTAKAGGFYGDNFGNDLYAPPVEFGGFDAGLGGGSSWNSVDPFSSPARYQVGGGGYQGKEGWVYGRGGHHNVDHMRIAQCLLLYKTEGIVQRIVHLLADFTVENIDLIHPDVTVHNFYQSWKTKVNLKDRLHRFVVDLLTTGNVFVWTQLAKLKDSEKRDMKRGLAAELIGDELVVSINDADGKRLRHKTISVEMEDDGDLGVLKDLNEACREHASAGHVNEVMLSNVKGDTRNEPADPQAPKQKSGQIPWRYTSLNPLQMEPRGSRFANEYYWVMLIHQRDMKPLSKFMTYRHYTDITTTKINLPEIFKGKLRPVQRGGSPYSAELQLDKDRLSVIQDVTKADYEDWATPHIYPSCKEVSFKRMLRQGEISAMESLKHMITLIKLGDTKEGFAPTEAQIERVAAALAGGSQAHHLIWDDLIEGQVLQPNVGNIFDPKKYTQVDKDIYAALGVAESVFSGNASYANSFMAIKLLLEKLETIRDKMEGWLRTEVKKIADSMKFKRLPTIQWGLMSLRDENAERKLWLDLYDRGIVSDTSILERFGTDFNIEAERQKLERVLKEGENPDISKPDEKFRSPVMVQRGPFNRDLVAKKQPAPGGQNGKSGRPSNTGKPLEKKRNTKPKGLGTVAKITQYSQFATSALDIISEALTARVVEVEGVKDSRSLTKAQKSDIEELMAWALAVMDPNINEVTADLVYKTIDENKKPSRMAEMIVELYKSDASNASTKEERLNLMSNAFAAVHAGLLEDIEDASEDS